MASRPTRRQFLAGSVPVGAAIVSGCTATTPFVGQRIEDHETISPGETSTLSVFGDGGEITVIGEDRDEVAIDIVKQSSSIRSNLDELRFVSEQVEDSLELRSEWDGSEGWFRDRPSMDLDIAMPLTLAVDRLETSVGRITVRDTHGNLDASTSTGRIDVENVDGYVSAETSTGRIEIADVSGIGDLRTSTGRISCEIPAIPEDVRVTTSTGRISAAIDPSLDAELTVRTSTGRVNVDDLPLSNAQYEDDFVSGTLGDGGPTLDVETSTGRITLTPLS